VSLALTGCDLNLVGEPEASRCGVAKLSRRWRNRFTHASDKSRNGMRPGKFDELITFTEALGFASVLAGPIVRSSYRADKLHGAAGPPLARPETATSVPAREGSPFGNYHLPPLCLLFLHLSRSSSARRLSRSVGMPPSQGSSRAWWVTSR